MIMNLGLNLKNELLFLMKHRKMIQAEKIQWFLLLLLTIEAAKMSDEKRGPYRSVLVSVKRCQNTTYPLAKDPTIVLNMAVVGTDRYRLLAGNVTVEKDTKQVKIKVKSFAWDGAKWKLTYVMNAASCRGSLLDLFCRLVSVNMLDTSRCVFLKGSYIFNSIDINTSQHFFSSMMEYGRTMWKSEVNVGLSTYQCWEFQTLVEPI